MAWFFEDEGGGYAEAVQEALATGRVRAVAPSLWCLEVANSLVVGERRKRTTEAKAHRFLSLLAMLPIRMDESASAHAWGGTIRLARSHILSAYDASYLELAARLELPLATLDGRLRAAAGTLGVAVFGGA